MKIIDDILHNFWHGFEGGRTIRPRIIHPKKIEKPNLT